MQLRKCFEIVEIGDEYMAIPTGKEMETYGGTVVLNRVSAFLLNHMKDNISKDELIALVQQQYDVDASAATKDINNIIDKFYELELLED